MRQRALTVALIAGCAILGGAGFLVYRGQDHEAPVIKVEKKEISYTDGENNDVLLEGVSAKDNKDGTLTKEVFVDKIVPADEGKAIVYYGVVDKAGNVGTARRSVAYYKNGEEKTEAEANAEQQTSEENQQDTQAQAENQPTPEQQTETPQAPTLAPNGASPAMALNADQMTIAAGEGFDPVSVVQDVVDDKDDRNTLFMHIHADGSYDTNTPGTYEIRYYVSDSDGHTSEPQIFTLTVQ